MGEALGLIETRGLVGAIEAADAMVKAANVQLVGMRKSVRACHRHGEGRCRGHSGCRRCWSSRSQEAGEVVAAHVIPRPHSDLERTILPTLTKQRRTSLAEGGMGPFFSMLG